METLQRHLDALSSLPGGYGIGSLGAPGAPLCGFSGSCGADVWQILPVGPTGYADSPYQSCSAFAGNPYFIDLDLLARDGLLKRKDYAFTQWGGDAPMWTTAPCMKARSPSCAEPSATSSNAARCPGIETPYPDDWYRFQFFGRLAARLLPVHGHQAENGMTDWQQWPGDLRLRDPAAWPRFRAEHARQIEFWAFLQYEFDRQWRALHEYASAKGVSIMGDIPIYVAPDSADAWAGAELFETDEDGRPRRVAGCPPIISLPMASCGATRCMTGTTTKRPATLGGSAGTACPDHLRHSAHRPFPRFRYLLGHSGGEAMPANGRWEQGPGMDLFRALQVAMGDLPIVAEDLGKCFPRCGNC